MKDGEDCRNYTGRSGEDSPVTPAVWTEDGSHPFRFTGYKAHSGGNAKDKLEGELEKINWSTCAQRGPLETQLDISSKHPQFVLFLLFCLLCALWKWNCGLPLPMLFYHALVYHNSDRPQVIF